MDSSKSAGWNDPPLFSYNESTELAKSTRGNLFKKRVAYPMNSTVVNTLTKMDPTTPCMHNPNLPPPPADCGRFSESETLSSPKKISQPSTETEIDIGMDALTTVLDVIEKCMETKELLKSQNMLDEVNKKLDVMKTMWADELNEDIKRRLVSFSKALEKDNIELCNEIQVGLMVDHPRQCSKFISGLRAIINTQK